MQELQNTIIAGLYLTQLVFRIQLNEAELNMGQAEFAEFTRSLETGDLSEAHYPIVGRALNTATAILAEQCGALQATRLTRGLFHPALLKVIIQWILSRADEFDWTEVGNAIPQVAAWYKLDKLINPLLQRRFGIVHPDFVRGQLNESLKLLDLVWNDLRATDADYRYASIWVNHFQDSSSLLRKFYEAGVTPRDDEDVSDAVANLTGGDSGRFEAFCVYHSLGLEMAQAWEEERVTYGHDDYKGALNKAMGYSRSNELHPLFASAIAAGYPVHYPEKDNAEFADLILKIPGYIHEQEWELVNNLIYTIAPLLFLELADDGRYTSHKWRGTRASSNYNETMQQLDDTVGESGWVPLVRLRASKFANSHFETHSPGVINLPVDTETLVELGRGHINQHPSTLRIIYLVDQLCEIIEEDFHSKRLFN